MCSFNVGANWLQSQTLCQTVFNGFSLEPWFKFAAQAIECAGSVTIAAIISMPKDVTDYWIRNSGVGNVELVVEIGVHFRVLIAEQCTVTCCWCGCVFGDLEAGDEKSDCERANE